MEQAEKSQSEKLSDALKALEPNVTKDDRKQAQEKFKISNATVSRYLNGEGPNSDLSADLIIFFRSKIEKRNKALTT